MLLLTTVASACAVIDGVSGEQQRAEDPTVNWRWHGPVMIGQASGASDAARLAVDTHGKAWATWYQWDNAAMTGTAWLTARTAGGSWATPVAVPPIPGWPVVTYPTIAMGATGDPVLAFQADDAVSGATRSLRAVRLHSGLNVNVADIARVDSTSSNTPQLSQGRSLAVDDAGHAVLVWGENAGIHASASSTGSTWSSPESLDSGTTTGWPTIDVSAGASGHAFAGWSPGASVLARPLDLTGGPVSAGALQTLATGNNMPGPVVATRGTRTLVVWTDGAGLFSRFYDGQWSAVLTITDQLAFFPGASLALNDNGQAVLVWRHVGGGDSYTGTISSAFFDGKVWSQPQTISLSGAARKCWWSSVGINNKGVAIASWADFDEGGTYARIWANVLRFSGNSATWGGPATIDESAPTAYLADQPENVRNISVGMDPGGTAAYVIYKQSETALLPRVWANWLE